MTIIHQLSLWDALPNAKYVFYVDLSLDFKRKLVENLPDNNTKVIRLINNSESAIPNNLNIDKARFYDWFRYHSINMPLWVAIELTKLASLTLSDLENNIVGYKQKSAQKYTEVRNPKLPITFDPVLVSFASHFCFDGSLPNDGHGTEYSQKNLLQVKNFVNKARACFGAVYFKISKDTKGIPKVRMPRFIGEMCKHICGFDSFGTFTSRIPKKILDLDRRFKLAVLISAIVDEGGISTEYIQLQLSNKGLVEDLRKICIDLNYSCSQIRKRERENHAYYFYIKSIGRLYKDCLEIVKEHNLISLTFKEQSIEYILNSRVFPHAKPTVSDANIRRELILSHLEVPKTSRQIAEELSIRPRTIRRLLLGLSKKGKLKRLLKGGEVIIMRFPID